MANILPLSVLEPYLNFADTLLQQVQPIALQYFRQPLHIDNKLSHGFDPVTAADKAIEEFLRAQIAAHYPDHGIMGEEYGTTPAKNGCAFSWTLDPIDGTRAFMTGLPTWGTLIALTHEGQPVVGALGQGFTGERFIGTAHGSFLRHQHRATQKLQVAAAVPLSQAVGFCTTPELFVTPAEIALHRHVHSTSRLLRYGTDCYGYAMLAAGYGDYVVEAMLQPYDIQAAIPLVQGAGGVVVSPNGADPAQGGVICAASSAALAHEMLLLS
jgi:histidinol phosphatase-like enzyme (inositol monophosphatase family)